MVFSIRGETPQGRPLGVSAQKANALALRGRERKVLARGHRVGRPRDGRRWRPRQAETRAPCKHWLGIDEMC